VIDALRRRWNTRAQSKFSRSQRSGRLAGAFAPAPSADVRGLRVVLIDDVCTSGATLEACAKALRAAGAESVRAFALARG
jgi:predicted amidophosphoribosyltransferase